MTFVVDDQGRALMGVEPYVALEPMDAQALIERARACADDPVPGEVAWVVREEGGKTSLVALMDASRVLSGANSLIADLAKTLKMEVSFNPEMQAQPGDEVMLVSDEHGVVGATDARGAAVERFSAYYERLVGQTKPDAFDRGNLGII